MVVASCRYEKGGRNFSPPVVDPVFVDALTDVINQVPDGKKIVVVRVTVNESQSLDLGNEKDVKFADLKNLLLRILESNAENYTLFVLDLTIGDDKSFDKFTSQFPEHLEYGLISYQRLDSGGEK
jgi:hypothetical protein